MVELLSRKDTRASLPTTALVEPDECVVIVDDSPEIILLLNHYLTKQGFTVFQASSAQELYTHLQHRKVALVLLDIGLPDSDGNEILDDLVANYQDLGIIMVTGSFDLQTALDCLRRGADDYLTKPVTMDQINYTVNNTLKKRRLAIDNRIFQRELEATNYRLQFLHQLNQEMNSAYLGTVELTGILQAILVGITSEEGLQFNRAFLALFNESGDILQGRIAIGPSNREDAGRVWNSIKERNLHLPDIIAHWRGEYQERDVEVNRIVQLLQIPSSDRDHVLIKAARRRKSILVTAAKAEEAHVPEELLQLLQENTFVIVPLYSPSRSLGVIIVDNFITNKPITGDDISSLEIFASQASLAIEHSHLYKDMLQKIDELELVSQELEHSKDLLVEAEKYSAIGHMSAQLAHAIRNPITSIGGTARLLARKSDDPYTINFLDIITKEASKIETILEDLLSFAQDHKLELASQPVNPLIRRCLMAFYLMMRKANITYDLDLPDDDIIVQIDATRIKLALLHLIRNAIEAMPDGGTLTVRVVQKNESCQISIKDTGVGISEAALQHVTDPFYTTKVYGTGMGLALVQRILTLHRGSLQLRPHSTGGMIAVITLPLFSSTVP
ncbi:response regulator [Desulfoprunum benzoelyticum]|uniref:histidine kinase n=1 Tax=Desulfoprunum benzoelyticum TaxID=1506996 RepID=A0A840UUR5_9BACT|nr:response regulator [Desulfoprunum benzoelyticum]MBB5347144.1 signal transduction histidine kinase [Desulfoprunum benzoelyticum]MBM9531223.1 response regulator [Desulfoprunum benzoelyticum]